MNERSGELRPTGDVRPADRGNLGPSDPHADPVTAPALLPTEPPTVDPAVDPKLGRTRFSGLWIGLIFSALVLTFLLIFILQNLELVRIEFLGASGTLPTGVALLLAAIAGVLLVAIPGTGRILQLRRAANRPHRTR
ncbi:MAG: lipopolysaccharide assembly protein LapA domain-containing protein [Pseudonocardia sp.]